ncbi:hypothetical protein IVA91_15085 [Bradyrhizobium sp. 153]|nr:hypothetical protein [Bradyrhizobium sp. 153]
MAGESSSIRRIRPRALSSGEMEVGLKALEGENAKLKKLLAEAMLTTPRSRTLRRKKSGDARRETKGRRSSADYVRGERAAGVQSLGADRASVRYRERRADAYRRLLVLMRREGLIMNQKKFRRLSRGTASSPPA